MTDFRDEFERRVIPRLRRNANITFELSAVDALTLRRTALRVATEHASAGQRESGLLWKRIAAQIEMGFNHD